MSTETNANSKFTENETPLYDPTSGKVVALRGVNVTQDGTTGIWYGDAAQNVTNGNANGQATMANSAPVVIASNQTGIGTLALPTITEDTIRNAARAGNSFYASTEELSPANANTAYSLFNPVASGKTIILHSINLQYSSAQSFARMRIVNANPSFAVTLNAANFNLGNANAGSATASIASVTYATATTTAPALSAASLAYGVMTQATNLTNELLTNSKTIALPAGTGFVVYFSNTAAGTLIFSFYWLEI